MVNPRLARAVLSIAVALIVLYALWQARTALLPFIFGAVIAVVLSPIVDVIARRIRSVQIRSRHPSNEASTMAAIAVVYVVGLGLLAAVLVLLVPMAISNIEELIERRVEVYQNISDLVLEWISYYEENTPDFIQQQIEDGVSGFGESLDNVVATFFTGLISVLTDSFALVTGFLVIPVWLIYVLKDKNKASDSFYHFFPENWQPDVREITTHSTTLLKRYIRVQLMLGAIVGGMAWIGLTLLDVPYALPLAIILGFTELIVIIGPIIGGVIAVLVTLAADPGWNVVWVAILVIGVQQIENYLLVPRMQGAAIYMNPAVVIVLLVVAGQIFGLLGVIVALPLAAVLRDAFIHIHWRLGEAAAGRPRASSGTQNEQSEDDTE